MEEQDEYKRFRSSGAAAPEEKSHQRMKTGIIVTITVWMLVSLLAIILLTVQVARLSSHVKRLEKAGQTTVSQNIPDSEMCRLRIQKAVGRRHRNLLTISCDGD